MPHHLTEVVPARVLSGALLIVALNEANER